MLTLDSVINYKRLDIHFLGLHKSDKKRYLLLNAANMVK